MIVSGGDDNAIVVSYLTFDAFDVATFDLRIKHTSAHAAQITGSLFTPHYMVK